MTHNRTVGQSKVSDNDRRCEGDRPRRPTGPILRRSQRRRAGIDAVPAPPTLVGVTNDRVAIRQPLRLLLEAPGGPSELVAVALVNIHIVPQTTVDSVRLDPVSLIRTRPFPSPSILRRRSNLAAPPTSARSNSRSGRRLGERSLRQLRRLRVSRVQKLPGVLSDSALSIDRPAAWLRPDRIVVGSLLEEVPPRREPSRTPPWAPRRTTGPQCPQHDPGGGQ